MSEKSSVWVVVVAVWAVTLALFGGEHAAHREFRDCRLLLQTADSATVLRTKPECERWTLPVTTEKP